MHSSEIRSHFRRLRRQLSAADQRRNADGVSENISRALGFNLHRRVGAYLATQGELSLGTWLSAGGLQQRIFLPKLYEPVAPMLRFAPVGAATPWRHNRFGILEPAMHWGRTVGAQKLDIILLPLVAFDREGRRMGMGGGYYDRSLAFRRLRKRWHSPRLLGIAHSCQEHAELPENPWDVRMDMIITEKEIIRAAPSLQK